MCFWMEVVEEDIFPKGGNEMSWEAKEWGEVRDACLRTICAGGAIGLLPLFIFLSPQESVPKRAWPQQSRDLAVF